MWPRIDAKEGRTSSTPLRNLSRRTKVSWKDYEHWSCGRHLPALVLPANVERCWLCTNKRPPMSARPPMPEGFEEKKPKAKAKHTPKRIAKRHQPSELDAMLTGSVAATLDAEVEPKPSRTPTPAVTPKVKAAPKAPTKAELAKAAGVTVTICAWHDCDEPARPRSKYCSRNCSNKNARARHKARVK